MSAALRGSDIGRRPIEVFFFYSKTWIQRHFGNKNDQVSDQKRFLTVSTLFSLNKLGQRVFRRERSCLI